MKYSLIILILVMSVLVYADVNSSLDKPADVNAGATLTIAKSSSSQWMTNWTIDTIISCLTRKSSPNYNYYSQGAEIGTQLANDLKNYLSKFPACESLLSGTLHAGSTAIFDIYESEGTATETENAGAMTCTKNGVTCEKTTQDKNILASATALSSTLYVGIHLAAHNIEEVTIRTSTATYRVYSDDPIVLDLDGDGNLEASNGNYLPHTLCVPESELVAFDMNADGFDELVEWVGANDGLLVHDITNNEVSGKNLFGDINGFKDGFEQLATLDANKDDALTGEELAGLAVWQDKNRNAKIDDGELHTLESLGITKLNVKAIELTATFERNGKYYMMWDWNPVTIMVKKTK